MDKWTELELELHQKHEDILRRRKALLQGMETYFDVNGNDTASFIVDIHKSEARNERLREEFLSAAQQIKWQQTKSAESPKLNVLKNNYWAMVRNVFPLWSNDLTKYEQAKRQESSPVESIRSEERVKVVSHRQS